MGIDFQNLANFGVKQVQKVATQVASTPVAKLDMPSDSFGGKILDMAGIERIMKKLDLIIAQAGEELASITKKYEGEKVLSSREMGSRQTWAEYKKASSAYKELVERRKKYQENPQLVQQFLNEEKMGTLATYSEIVKCKIYMKNIHQ